MGTQSTKTARRPAKASRGTKKTAKNSSADKSARTSLKKPASKSSRRVAATTTRGARPATASFVAKAAAKPKSAGKAPAKPAVGVSKPVSKAVAVAKPIVVKPQSKAEAKAEPKAAAKTLSKNLSKTVSKIAAQIAAKMASGKESAKQAPKIATKEATPAPKMIRTYSPPVQPAAPELPIVRHKYSVGETVYFTSPNFGRAAASGTYTVIKLLPSESDDYQYRIKSSGEAFERVAKESQLDRV